GGYLVILVEDLFRNPFSWDGLKTALKTGEVTIEEPGERMGFITAKGLKPEAIPLNLKVVLIGTPIINQILYTQDPDFSELFKVKAEFDTSMERTEENIRKYETFICTLCKKDNLKHLDKSAVAKMVEFGSRLADDQRKLTTRFAHLADIIREASYYATLEKAPLTTEEHILKAIEEKTYRSSLIREKIQEFIRKGVFLIETAGSSVGQLNGLSVISLGDIEFGRPSRVTASVGVGRGGIMDIEREASMGGPIHTKGVLILGGYLASKYAQDKPFGLSAKLVFEQSYEGVEGDSASSTELYAILSALSGLPLKQSIAVTGSVNQKGEVQAIGGVNQKLEGFFEVCKAKGLTGDQGAMIPASNVQNLMLKEEMVEAAKAGKFTIYPVRTIDEGIEVLTGVKAGERRADGTFEEGTVNYLVDKRLKEMAATFKEYMLAGST
ncbi:MAG: AAA family ATPase, partial [Methanomicrobiales archaeon]|nr:AAA family ATPase [Methanomicrobiales archaeon]